MADHKTIITWLQEAGAHAFKCEDPTVGSLIQADVLCHSATVGVRVRRGAQVEYRNISWDALARAEVAVNPLLPLIDAAIEAIVGKAGADER
jgi:hypothetical protein